MEEKDAVSQATVNDKEQTETSPRAEFSKKSSGDGRVFIISLLTAIIVVLAYHGIILGIRCIKNNCPGNPPPSGQCQMPAPQQCIPAPCCHRHNDAPAPRHHRQAPRFNHPGDRQNHHGQRQDGQRRQRRPRPQRPEQPAAAPEAAPTSQEPAE